MVFFQSTHNSRLIIRQTLYKCQLKYSTKYLTSQFSCSVMSDSLHPMDCSTPGFSVHHQLPELAQIHVHQISDGHPTIASSVIPFFLLPSIFSSIRVSSSESALHIRWPKYWSFSFSISPSSEYSGLISFKMDCLGLLAVQGTLQSLIQHHISKAPIIWCSAFYSPTLTSIHDHWKNHSFG